MKRVGIPETVDPGDWKVFEGGGMCDVAKKIFSVPPQNDPYSEAIAVHELLHARYSESIDNVRSNDERMVLNLFEDARMNCLGVEHGLQDRLMPFTRAIGQTGTPLFESIFFSPFKGVRCGKLRPRESMLSIKYGDLIWENRNSAQNVATLARQFLMECDFPIREQLDNVDCLIEMNYDGEPFGPIEVDGKLSESEIMEQLDNFARLKIIEPPMKSKDYRRPQRRTDTGFLLRRPERVYTDKMCFVEPRKPKYGTILVDCSGSMSIGRQNIERVTMSSNGSTLAGYVAYNDDASIGGVWILSKAGKVVRKLPDQIRDGGYNSCDLPALMWLSQQRGPHVWVSDGGCNGIHGRHEENMREACFSFAKNHKIRRFGNIDQLFAYMEDKNESGRRR